MESESQFATDNLLQQSDSRDQSLNGNAVEGEPLPSVTLSRSIWITGSDPTHNAIPEAQLTLVASDTSYSDPEGQDGVRSMSLAEFVHRKFNPEYVQIRRSAGRAHFHAILKHVFSPEQVARAFAGSSEYTNV